MAMQAVECQMHEDGVGLLNGDTTMKGRSRWRQEDMGVMAAV